MEISFARKSTEFTIKKSVHRFKYHFPMDNIQKGSLSWSSVSVNIECILMNSSSLIVYFIEIGDAISGRGEINRKSQTNF